MTHNKTIETRISFESTIEQHNNILDVMDLNGNSNEMYVIKRNGEQECVSFDKVLNRLKNLSTEDRFKKKLKLNVWEVAQKVCTRIYNKVSTTELDEFAAQICAGMGTTNPDYSILASRIAISNHHKNTSPSFSESMYILYNNKDKLGNHSPLISKKVYDIAMKNKNKLNDVIDYMNDFKYDYFGYKTLERAYLMRVNRKIVERPQQMLMRVALGIHLNDFKDALNTYKLMSEFYFVHATPTLFNSGTPKPQMSSCFLMTVGDSIVDIYKSLTDSAVISQGGGGIGLSHQPVRAKGSYIRGTNGKSNGLIPMLRVCNDTARYVDQCVVPETYIFTTSGVIQIQYCVPNETAIFTTNGVEIIQNVLEHPYKGTMLCINDPQYKMNKEPDGALMITGEHPIYCIKNNEHDNYEELKERLTNKTIVKEWVEAKELNIGDFIAYKIPTYFKNVDEINESDCFMYGLILGYGTVSNSETRISCILSKKNLSTIDFIYKYLADKCIEYIEDDNLVGNENCIEFEWRRGGNLNFKYADFYNTSNEKSIHSKWLNLPVEKTKHIVRGLFGNITANDGQYMFNSDTMQIMSDIKFLLLKMGIIVQMYPYDLLNKVDATGLTIHKKSYCLKVPRLKSMCELIGDVYKNDIGMQFKHEDYVYEKVRTIDEIMYSGVLYDLQLKETHDYMLSNGIVHNGGGKRKGSFASYIEPWHADIHEWLDLKKNHGNDNERARDLFFGLWIPDLFMKRVDSNLHWTLMCPDECPHLCDTYGAEFETLYEKYESEGRGKKTINARDLFLKIITSQIETGTPYMLYKDACNSKSNQQNLGTIRSSNLCTEIIEYTSPDEIAVCNLASIGLPRFLKKDEVKMQQCYVIFTKINCVHCNVAKMLLKNDEVQYIECNLTDEKVKNYVFNALRKLDGSINTFPQIFAIDHDVKNLIATDDKREGEKDAQQLADWCIDNATHIGGCDNLLKYLQPAFDFDELITVSRTITKNLNKIIDRNYYPVVETLTSNKRHRPIGIGVQGLADVFALMHIAFDSPEAKILNKQIFETIYYGSLLESLDISKKREPLVKNYIQLLDIVCEQRQTKRNNMIHILDEQIGVNICEHIEPLIDDNATDEYKLLLDMHRSLLMRVEEINRNSYLGSYSSFEGSPMHKGKFQFDLWDSETDFQMTYNWDALRDEIAIYGIRNSLLIAPMPTASTSQILGNNECFEPFTSNIYTRKTLAGEYIVTNKHLMKDLINLDIWSQDMKEQIIIHDGSVLPINEIPDIIKNVYKIVWEISQKTIIDLASDRGRFVCQSQSMNLSLKSPSGAQVSSMHMYAWEKGLKTGMYYLRAMPKTSAQKFTIDPSKVCENCSA